MARRALLVAVALMVGGCAPHHDSAQLTALKADPMASYQPEGGTPALSSEDDRREGSSAHKPREASVLHTFTFATASEVTAAIRSGTERARDHGWQLSSSSPAGALLTRSCAETTCTLTLATTVTTPTTLAIRLTAASF
jgi:hypothetical protein